MFWLLRSLYESAAMFWEVLWALVLGFGVSAALQVFESKDRMPRKFGTTSFRSVALATVFGGASSSCIIGRQVRRGIMFLEFRSKRAAPTLCINPCCVRWYPRCVADDLAALLGKSRVLLLQPCPEVILNARNFFGHSRSDTDGGVSRGNSVITKS